jgi:hypothetical protein
MVVMANLTATAALRHPTAEQLHSKLRLQIMDLAAQWWLSNSNPLHNDGIAAVI